MKKYMILFLIVFLASQTIGTEYYVSTSGSDANTGTRTSPFATIQKCADTVYPGDTCLVGEGTYPEKQVLVKKGGTPTSRVTFKAEGNVVMRGFYLRNSSIVIDGFNITQHKGMWTSYIHNKDVRNLKDLHIYNNVIHDGNNIFLTDATLTSRGTIYSQAGGFIDAGFELGDQVLITCDKNTADGDNRDFYGRMILDSVTDTEMAFHPAPDINPPIDLANAPCRAYINTYGISIDADSYEIANNTLYNLWGNFINLGGKNGLVDNNHIYTVNTWDVFRVFGENHIIRNNYVHDSVYQRFIGNHPDLFQAWGAETLDTLSRNITIERNFFAHMDTQISMLTPLWNHDPNLFNPGVRDWRLFNNVFYNTTIQANTDIPAINWSNNIFYHVLGTGGAGTVLVFGTHSVDSAAYNNVFLATGGNQDSHGWYSQGGTGFYADYNYIANTPPSYRPKLDRCPGSYNFCEPNGINGGDPSMQNVDDPLGPDKIPFTNDDGLIPLSNSFLCNAGNGGKTIGAYECQGCISDKPIAFFSLDKQQGYEPLEVSFDASKSLACSGTLSYYWDFGDGTVAQGEKVQKTFSNGLRKVTLTVKNSRNLEARYEKTLSIYPSLVPNLVLYLNLDDNIQDWSGRNHYTEWEGNTYATGKVGRAATFDTTGINVRYQDDLDSMPRLTIALWAKKNSPDLYNLVVQKHITYTLTILSKGFTSYLMNASGRFDISTTTQNNDTLWHHYALTYDGINARLFFDGVEVASKPFSGTIARNPDRDIMIGKNIWGSAFDGAMDEVRIYDRALEPSEIKNLFEMSDTNTRKGDLDKNGRVDILDIKILIGDFGTTNLVNDLNSDNKIDLLDVMIIIQNWG